METNEDTSSMWVPHGEIEEDQESIEPPPYSPISVGGTQSDYDSDVDDKSASESSVELDTTQVAVPGTSTNGESSAVCVADQRQSPDFTAGWDGFKLVGDNVDKNIRASYQRIDYTTRSLHYFHVYAVLDRVDFSGLSDEALVPSSVNPLSLIPSSHDIRLLHEDFSVLVSR